MLYEVLKVIHVAAIISWMAGILYLYRILINMVDHQEKGAAVHEVLFGMGLRLYRYITMPAMGVAYIAGFAMAALEPSFFRAGFFHFKLLFVLLLTIATAKAGKLLKGAQTNAEGLPAAKKLRIMNEIPTLLMILILIMIIIRP